MAIDGKWNLTIKTPLGERSSTLDVKSAGGKLTGTQTADDSSQPIDNGEVNGDAASWSVDITSPMPMTLSFNGAVAGDSLSGTVRLGAFGESTFSGERA